MSARLNTKKIVFVALMAALTAVGSALRVTLPLSIAGTTSFHLGNIFCALSGILLGPWLGGLASGLGSAIYDMFSSYISEAWLTFLTKGAYGLAAGVVIRAGAKQWGYVRALLATLTGAMVYALLYLTKSYFYNGLLLLGLTSDAAWLTVLGKLPATIFNAVVALVFAPVLAVALRRALTENHLLPDSVPSCGTGRQPKSDPADTVSSGQEEEQTPSAVTGEIAPAEPAQAKTAEEAEAQADC